MWYDALNLLNTWDNLMFTNAIAEQMIVGLVAELKKGVRFVDYEDERLFQRAIEQAELLHLMILGLAVLEYIDPDDDEVNNGFQMHRAANNPIWQHSWVRDMYGEE